MNITSILKKENEFLKHIENAIEKNQNYYEKGRSLEIISIGDSLECDKRYSNYLQNENVKFSYENDSIVMPKFALLHIIRDVKNEIEYSKVKPENGLYLTHEQIGNMLYEFRKSGNDFSSITKDLETLYQVFDYKGEICIKDEYVNKDKEYILTFKLFRSRSEFDFWKSIRFNTSI